MDDFHLPPSESPFRNACRRLLSEIVLPPTLVGIPVRIDPSATQPELHVPGRRPEALKLVQGA